MELNRTETSSKEKSNIIDRVNELIFDASLKRSECISKKEYEQANYYRDLTSDLRRSIVTGEKIESTSSTIPCNSGQDVPSERVEFDDEKDKDGETKASASKKRKHIFGSKELDNLVITNKKLKSTPGSSITITRKRASAKKTEQENLSHQNEPSSTYKNFTIVHLISSNILKNDKNNKVYEILHSIVKSRYMNRRMSQRSTPHFHYLLKFFSMTEKKEIDKFFEKEKKVIIRTSKIIDKRQNMDSLIKKLFPTP
jgi:hypothetical protein